MRSHLTRIHFPLLGQGSDVLVTGEVAYLGFLDRCLNLTDLPALSQWTTPSDLQFDEISSKFIAANGLFRLEDRVIANARDAVLKSAKRQISARILRKRCPASDRESSRFPRSIASHETSSEPCSVKRETAGIWSKTGAQDVPRAT